MLTIEERLESAPSSQPAVELGTIEVPSHGVCYHAAKRKPAFTGRAFDVMHPRESSHGVC